MNKILVNNQEQELNQEIYQLQGKTKYVVESKDFQKPIKLVIKKEADIILEILSNGIDLDLSLEMEEGSFLTLSILMIQANTKIDAILLGKEAKLFSNVNVISKKDCLHQIKVIHQANGTVCELKNHGFSLEQATLMFDVSATVLKDAKKCISHQDNQIIEQIDSISQIHPNLYIDNYDVEASHSAYIGKFKEQELFYLMSRGISERDSYLLLLKAFLTNCFREEKDKYIDNIIKYYSC